MPLSPDDFKADLTAEDIRKLRQEVRAEQVRQMRAVEFTVSAEADPHLVQGEVIWLEVPLKHIRGRYRVASARLTSQGVRYTLISEAGGGSRTGEKVVRIERL